MKRRIRVEARGREHNLYSFIRDTNPSSSDDSDVIFFLSFKSVMISISRLHSVPDEATIYVTNSQRLKMMR